MSQLHQIALTYLKNIGPSSARSLMSYFGEAEAVFKAPASKILKVPGIGEKTIATLDFKQALEKAENELHFIEKNGVDVIFYTDARYPKRLKNCTDAPVLLYSKGNADFNKQRVVSIVGTRNATEYGKDLCRQLIEDLKQYDVLVLSGLALGIDVAVHKECLKNNVPTVGVVGHGLDRLYPAANRATADKMLENGGLLSEYPSETKPDRENFPQRNRMVVLPFSEYHKVVHKPLGQGYTINPQTLGEHIRNMRLEKRMTQEQVAKKWGINVNTLSCWENDKTIPEVWHYPTIIELLGYYPPCYDTNTFAGKLRMLRYCKGYTFKQLGVELGMHPATLCLWEKGKTKPSIAKQQMLLKLIERYADSVH